MPRTDQPPSYLAHQTANIQSQTDHRPTLATRRDRSVQWREPYVWIGPEEILRLPMQGKPWQTLLATANEPPRPIRLADINENADVQALAKALVAVRCNDPHLVEQVRHAVLNAIGTEAGGSTLGLGRNLVGVVVAANLVGLPPDDEARFRDWLRSLLHEPLQGRTLVQTHETRPNNWGTVAGAARAAIAVYLQDRRELERTAQVFRGWLGDRSAYEGFRFGDPIWQVDPEHPLPIQPVGATLNGHSIDGALADDLRRGGPFQWPPRHTGYPWGALQGAVVQAEILYRQGYDTWNWQHQALLRAVRFLYSLGWQAEGDDRWILYLINARYATDFPADPGAKHGKNMAWTGWTHGAQGSRLR